jgi:hypothetical protein
LPSDHAPTNASDWSTAGAGRWAAHDATADSHERPNARPLQRCDATRYAILEAPIRAAASLATRYPGSPSDTTPPKASSTRRSRAHFAGHAVSEFRVRYHSKQDHRGHPRRAGPSDLRRPRARCSVSTSRTRDGPGAKASSKSRSGTQNRAISADPGRMRTADAILTPSNCQEPVGRESAIYVAMTRVRMVR